MRRIVVLGIAVAVTSLMPVVGVADDQKIADFIKFRLQAEQQQGNLQGFNVDMRVEEGTVWFKGHVSNADQEMTILKTGQAAAHFGVLQVVDDIEIIPSQARQIAKATPAQNFSSPTSSTAAARKQVTQVGYQQGRSSVPAYSASFSSGTPTVVTEPSTSSVFNAPTSTVIGNTPLPYDSAPVCLGPDCGGYSDVGQPIASGLSGNGGQALGSESPSLPGYAWPSYAAHPNFGNVSYPQQYSPSAWPYIGPFYPYPQVPLGWRKVTLEWDDGFWMLDFHDK